ncbi:MAG: alpha/beta fold hydrolase [Curvibacter lanceolatus]|uniref:alpha/beta fold hydrolase n=1 Tax=Curvibacter lanceolatus TaxID=86182 RepID=UPI00035EEDA7|nr:alpha/beta fold hydrolase [Curvibacter lanceolatus]MBV5292449.1 alpha/beta fold hydrolase [Curvibacter lanceolatus]
MKLQTRLIDLEIRDQGPAKAPVVLLIMGLGMQLISWPSRLVDTLLAAGYRVIRFDNRDAGLSQRYPELGVPNLPWAWLRHAVGLPIRPPYSLQDMARDTLSLLDALDIASAHVLGVDLGGMIGQHMALMEPARVRSLCSVMSSSGARHLPGPGRAVRAALLREPAGVDTASLLAHQQALFHLLRSPCFPQDLEDQRKRLLAGIHRAVYPEGVVRQLAAVLADTQRAAALAQLQVPTLVVHGRQDPLLPVACGEDTARRIPGARLLTIEGMGHDLPPGVVQALLAALLPHLKMH